MSEGTVYLIYNTNSTNFKLQKDSQSEDNEDLTNKMWEYIDKDEFTIMYSKEDERKYTDIKILSKTKLKERPQSADELQKKPRGSVEGILIRRANSLPNIERDMFYKKRSPLIKPLLSETEILRLQEMHEMCRRQKFGYDKQRIFSSELRNKGHILQLGFENQTSLKDTYDWKYSPKPQSKTQEVLKTSPFELRNKRKPSSHPLESDNTIQTNIKTKKNAHIENLGAALSKTTKGLSTVKNKKERTKKSYFEDNKPVSTKTKLFPSKINSKTKIKPDLKTNQSTTSTLNNNNTKKVDSSKEKDKSLQKTKENVLKSNLSDKNNYDSSMNETVKSKTKKPSKSIHSPKEMELNSGEESEKKFKQLKSKSEEGIQEQDKNLKKRITAETDGAESSKTKKGLKSKSSGEGKSEQLTGRSTSNGSGSEKYATSEKNKVSSEHSKKNQKNIQNRKDEDVYETVSRSKLLENREGSTKNKNAESRYEKPTFNQENKSNVALNKELKTSENNVRLEKFGQSKNNTEKYNMTLPRGKKYSNLVQYMVQYVLSNPVFIKLGWTLHPTDPLKSRLVTFKALPTNSKSYFLRHRDKSEIKYYPSGCLALEILDNGTGRLNYSSGSPAIVVSKNELGMIMKLYSDPIKDPLIKESFETIVLGVFDSFGNGVVYGSHGKKTLVFNQMKGIYYKTSKMIYNWKWGSYEVLEKHRLKELLATMVIETKKLPKPFTKRAKSISRSHSVISAKKSEIEKKTEVDKLYDTLLAELPHPEVPNFKVKEKSHKTGFKPIILKISKEITLRINSQESIILNFSGNKFFYKMDLGVRIDPETVVRIDEVDLDQTNGIPCTFDV